LLGDAAASLAAPAPTALCGLLYQVVLFYTWLPVFSIKDTKVRIICTIDLLKASTAVHLHYFLSFLISTRVKI